MPEYLTALRRVPSNLMMWVNQAIMFYRVVGFHGTLLLGTFEGPKVLGLSYDMVF